MQQSEWTHLVANAKLAGIGATTSMVGFWTWLGENQSSLGGLASLVGIVGVCVAIYRGRQKEGGK